MSNGSELKSAGALALRRAGFIPLPRWWVTEDQFEVIRRMAMGNDEVVNQIRESANRKARKKGDWDDG